MPRPKKPRTKEHYYQAAKKHGYRARSAYKLRQVATKHHLLKGVNKVLDLCCAPGSWTQVLLELDAGLRVVAVDLSPIKPMKNVSFIQGDITNPETVMEIEKKTEGSVDLVISDCSPKVSGNWELDTVRQLALVEATIQLAQKLLTPSGKVFTKVFQGKGFQEFLSNVKRQFHSVRLVKPEASRRTSAEIYLLASGPIR
ncbi:MAG: RlmE family RNA methyltransferase [Candidatus Thorarchaeota archaeon]|nr:MAG: RlmE family RNA methyltransferase [Candidatus Thorarchaeota archaeon]